MKGASSQLSSSDAPAKEVDTKSPPSDHGNNETTKDSKPEDVVPDNKGYTESDSSAPNPSDADGSAVSSPSKAAGGMERSSRVGGSGGGGGRRNNRSLSAGGYSGVTGSSNRHTDFPLRILVQSDMVGAIIGRQGTTIRNVTQQTRARVDVHRKDNIGSLEKAITIYGNPENCTNACKKILEVMQQEANNTNKGEICLKILAHNNLIGRIIGKAGNTIKKIMQDTDTKITVSSINDINSYNVERIITVKGLIENMSKAEAQISARLKQSYENDMQVMSPQNMLFPGLHPMGMLSMGSGLAYPAGRQQPSYQQAPLYPAGPAPTTSYPPIYTPTPSLVAPFSSSTPDVQESTYLYIPNSTVGAIIGTKGSTIRNMIRFSGASIKIAPLEEDKNNPSVQPTDRKVTIVGTAESQWKAQYLIFEKMREEGLFAGADEVRLTIELVIPSSQVGRIIGKGGQNVRELQRTTGSIIKLPNSFNEEETNVHIVGTFYSVQSAQRRIRSMITPTATTGVEKSPPRQRSDTS